MMTFSYIGSPGMYVVDSVLVKYCDTQSVIDGVRIVSIAVLI